MSDVNIIYKGNSIATLDDTGDKILLTQGKYCEDNIKLAYTKPSVELKPYVLRPDAELIQSYHYDKYVVADEGLTIPAYATSAKVVKASWSLTPTLTVDLADYRYYIVERFLTIPEYSVTTKAKGRVEYQWACYIYEYTRLDANKIATIIDPSKKVSASNIVSTSTLYRMLYWSSASAIALYATNAYGCYQVPTAPSVSGSTMTVKAPSLDVRGSTAYFTSTFMNALTDIRYQFAMDVYRVPEKSLNIIGWQQEQILQHITDCIVSDGHNLT